MSFIDLHVHSNASDGTLTPTEVVNLAKEKKLTAIALTDHDTMEGVKEATEAAKGSELEIISGVEISCEYKEKEIHILGLFVDIDCEELLYGLDICRKKRDERNEKMLLNFQKAGILMTMEELDGGNPNAVITRAHFARYLVEHGYVKKKDDAFKKYLGKKCSFYVPREYMKPEKAIQLIKKAGGLSFLAHAYLYKMSDKEIEQMVEQLISYGLDGIEVYHSSHNICESRKLQALAKKKGLLISGGSDFHGTNKPDIDLSVGRGNLRLPHYILEDIKKSKEKDKEEKNVFFQP
ncbi:MAG: PHP domain-containing protein [Lachnospiraceae bacterium]